MATVAGSLRNKVLVVDDLTSGDITVTDLVVSGTVTLQGTATTLDSTNTTITDSIIELNSGLTGSNTKDIGFVFERGSTGNNAAFIWDESADRFTVITTTGTAADNTLSGTVANFQAGSFFGNGANLTSLNGSNISSGTVAAARIASLAASKITSGTFADARIPSLAASKITSGTFADARIPSLAASKITSGTFADARIPSLAASKITSGTFADARISSSSVTQHLGSYLTGNQTITLSGDVSGSGTTSISVTVNDDSHFHHRLDSTDDRDMKPSTSGIHNVQALKPFFSSYGGMTGTANTTYVDVLAFDTYSDSSGGGPSAITFKKGNSAGNPEMHIWKAGWNATTWSTGQRVYADNYHPNADKWTTARTLSLTGDVTGSVSWDGSGNASITTAVANNSHQHSQLYENGTITFGDSYVQWTDQNGTGGTGLNGAAPRNPANGWYHNLIMNHANSSGYYSQIATGLNSSDIYFSRVQGGTAQSWQRIFADDYHPNADKWTTARSHTVTLTGEVTGTASQTVDGTGNKTWSIGTTISDSALDNQYVQVLPRHNADGDSLVVQSKASITIWDVSGASDEPSGASDGLVLSAGWDSSSWGIQQFHDFHSNDLYLRAKNNGSMTSWDRVFHDTYHPNADKWTTARSHTVTLTGEVTGTATQSVDGTGNKTWSIATTLGNTALDDQYVQQLPDLTSGAPTYQTPSSRRVDPNAGNPTNHHYAIMTYGNGGNVTGQLATHFQDGSTYNRAYNNSWSAWSRMFDDDYHPNADTLTTARTINGVSFNGSANITVADSTKLPLAGGTMTGALVVDVDNVANGALRITANQTNPANDFYFAQEIVSTLSGSGATGGDREQGGIYIDLNSNATGGDTADEHRVYGIYADVDSTGDADVVTAGYFNATATPTTGTTTQIAGVEGFAEDNGGAGATTNVIGVKGTAWSDNSTSDVNLLYGGSFKAGNAADSGAIGGARGVSGEIELASGSGDIYGSSYVFEAQYDNNTGAAPTHTAALYYGNYAGTLPTTPLGVYIVDAVPNSFGGSIRTGLGSTALTSYGFIGDLNTGMYSPANHQLGFAVNGSRKILAEATKITFQNITAGVDIDGTLQTNNSVKVTGIAAANNSPAGDEVELSGYGLIGNRGNFYLTNSNASGQIVMGISGAHNANPKLTVTTSGITVEGNIIVSGTVDGVDIASRNSVLTSTTTTANAALPKAGGTMTGDLTIPDKIIHSGDTDTYMSFAAADEWHLYCGGVRMIKVVEASSNVDYISFFPGTGNTGEIYFDGNGNGHFDANVTAYSSTTGSDKRLKENIRPLENSLDKVLGLDGVMFDWKKETRGKDQIGFIAQQVEEHVPELVGTMEDIDIGEAKTVNYEAVVPMLVEALKEQQSIINRLESRIKDLEDKG